MSVFVCAPPPTVTDAREEITAADVLERAADLLEEFGWCQDKDGSKASGAMCARGAAKAAGVDLGVSADEATTMLYTVLPFHVSVWNDKPGRTREEVVRKLRDAAAHHRASSREAGALTSPLVIGKAS